MFLRFTERFKNGKHHRYCNIVENKRTAGNRVVQRQVLYLGEINDSQQEQLETFWKDKLLPTREGTKWLNVFKTLTAYRLIDPGSEWYLHRTWYEQSAMGDLLGEDFALVQKDKLYRCMDKLLVHKKELSSFLQERWRDMFNARFDVLLYDLTSTYFECDVTQDETGKRKFGYSRDKRSDCVQVVIALIVTPEGFPLAYEVMPGNTKDSNTLEEFLAKIENQIFSRFTQPEREHKIILSQLKMHLPAQPTPKITAKETVLQQ